MLVALPFSSILFYGVWSYVPSLYLIMNDTVLSDRRGLLFLVNLLLDWHIYSLEFTANLTPAHTFFGKTKACFCSIYCSKKRSDFDDDINNGILLFLITNLNLYFKKHPQLLGMIMTMVSLASLEALSKSFSWLALLVGISSHKPLRK